MAVFSLISSYKCCKCGIEKALTEFSKDNRKKYKIRTSCKECNKDRFKRYDSSEAGQKRMRKGKWKQQGIDITHDTYLMMYNKQAGKCAICNNVFPSLCVDHNHDTGKIRGLLCRQCNLGIAGLKEKEENFINAIKYLKEYV
jgi:hypothetical protein